MEEGTSENETKIDSASAVKVGLCEEKSSDIRVFQAGGHPDQIFIDKRDPQRIIKKTYKTELNFYESLVHQLEQHSPSGPLHTLQSPWSGWRPKFFGRLVPPHSDLSLNAENEALIILENLTHGRPVRTIRRNDDGDEVLVRLEPFKHPNVVDIKLGQRLYDDQAGPEKMERMKKAALETTSARFGIRMTGAQLWDNLKGEYRNIPKSFGKSINPNGTDLSTKFNTFFPISDGCNEGELCDGEIKTFEGLTQLAGHLPSNLLKKIIDRSLIPKIQEIMNYVTSFNWTIYGSSLLIIFEADLKTLDAIFSSYSLDTDLGQTPIEALSTVKIIDFAHVHLADRPDQGILKGFQSVLELFKQLSLKLGSLKN